VQGPGAALEQGHAQLFLQGLDLAADGRLTQVQLFPRLGEGEVAGGGDETLDGVQGWQAVQGQAHGGVVYLCVYCIN